MVFYSSFRPRIVFYSLFPFPSCMGFFGRLRRGRAKGEPLLIELRLGEVSGFVEKKAGEKKYILEKDVPARFSEIKHTIRETKGLLKDLEKTEISDAGNKRFRKAARTAKKDSIKKIDSVLHKIQPPFTEDAERIRSYCYESLSLLQQKIRSSSRSITYTSVILKDVMKKIGRKIEALEQSFKSLVETIKSNIILFEKKKLHSLVSGIEEDFREAGRIGSEKGELLKALKAVSAEKRRAEAAIEELLNSDASTELQGLEARRKEILLERLSTKNELVNTVVGIARPIKKLDNLTKRGKYFLEEDSQVVMGLFLKDPEVLFRQDPKGDRFKQLLRELKGAIAAEKLELKSREREKKMGEIEFLLGFDFFSNFFWRENKLEKELKEISGKEGAMEVKGEMDSLKRSLLELEHDFNEINSAARELERREAALAAKNKASLEKLGSMLSEMTSEKIRVVEEKARALEPEKP